MTVIRHFYCDYCNPDRHDASHAGVTEFKAYTAVDGDEFPSGWWEVPGKGAGRGGVGHACPDCVLNGEGVVDDIRRRRDAQTRRMVDELDEPV